MDCIFLKDSPASILYLVDLLEKRRRSMGKDAICMEEFLQDKERFADLFNGSLFLGKRVILPEELLSASENMQSREKKKVPCRRKEENGM